jgi:hypothetical protein
MEMMFGQPNRLAAQFLSVNRLFDDRVQTISSVGSIRRT